MGIASLSCTVVEPVPIDRYLLVVEGKGIVA